MDELNNRRPSRCEAQSRVQDTLVVLASFEAQLRKLRNCTYCDMSSELFLSKPRCS